MRLDFLALPISNALSDPRQRQLLEDISADTGRKGGLLLHVHFQLGAAFKARPLPGHEHDALSVTLSRKEQSFLDASDAVNAILARASDAAVVVMLHTYGAPLCVKRRITGLLAKRCFRITTHKTDTSNAAFAMQRKRFVVIDTHATRGFWEDMQHRVRAASIARELASEPASVLYPEAFCDRVRQLFARAAPRIKVTCLGPEQLKRMGMNLVLAVGAGSVRLPRLLIIEEKEDEEDEEGASRSSQRPICLVGKGVCFDAGGLDIKPDSGMRSMHTDKTGGAVVVPVMHYLWQARQQRQRAGRWRRRVVGIVPLVENLPSGSAAKPHDVVKSYAGKTVEIDNTDAEGRLILADALAYACDRYDPCCVVDFATLTGWSSRLFCDSRFAYYTASDAMAQLVDAATERAGERAVADLKNSAFACGGPPANGAGAGYMAAMFLLNFVPERLWDRWVHVDITHADDRGAMGNANSVDTAFELTRALLHLEASPPSK